MPPHQTKSAFEFRLFWADSRSAESRGENPRWAGPHDAAVRQESRPRIDRSKTPHPEFRTVVWPAPEARVSRCQPAIKRLSIDQ